MNTVYPKATRDANFISLLFSFERKGNKSYKSYGNYTILFVGIYVLWMIMLWFLRKHILLCLPCPVECEAYSSGVSRENIFFLCELCVLSEAGGEKILPLIKNSFPLDGRGLSLLRM